MTIFLLFVMIAVMLAIDLARRSERRELSQSVKADEVGGVSILGQRFFHPGHSWMTVDSAEQVTVGADEFARKLVGKLSSVSLPKLGAVIKQGEVIGSLSSGTRTIPQVSPISGMITEVNAKLVKNPELLNESPLEKGWTVKVTPWGLTREIRNLLRENAAKEWQEAVRHQLLLWFSQSHIPAMQDGGTIIENVGGIVNDEQWNQLVADFFQVTYEEKGTRQE
jgi:glycine cleavage system H lipoate-binding protein